MSTCPNCGGIEFMEVADYYAEEVRKADPDLDLLARIAPPTRLTSIHGFIMGTLFWILLLVPFFAPEGKVLRTTLPIAGAALAWVPIFILARRKDRVQLAEYQSRQICLNCGTIV